MNSWNIYYTLNTPYKNDSQSIRIITNYLGNLWKNSIYQKIWRSVKKHKARIARQVIVVWSFAALPCLEFFWSKNLMSNRAARYPASRWLCVQADMPAKYSTQSTSWRPRWRRDYSYLGWLMMPHLIEVVEALRVVDHDYDFQKSLGGNALVLGKGSISCGSFVQEELDWIWLTIFDLDTLGLKIIWL